jgi:hypothetical protein
MLVSEAGRAESVLWDPMLVSQSWLLTLLGFQEVLKYLRGAFLAACQFDPTKVSCGIGCLFQKPSERKVSCRIGCLFQRPGERKVSCGLGSDACFSILAAHFAGGFQKLQAKKASRNNKHNSKGPKTLASNLASNLTSNLASNLASNLNSNYLPCMAC